MTKTEQLREKIAEYLHGVWILIGNEVVPHYNSLSEEGKGFYRKKADQILKACKEAGLAFVAEDAELPELPNDGTPECILKETGNASKVAKFAFGYCWREMIRAGFRQTEEIESEVMPVLEPHGEAIHYEYSGR